MNSQIKMSCAALLVALAGCGGSDRLETARVRGTVTLDGQTYTQGGSVIFQPEASGKMATGQIQSDGSYELATYSPGDGGIVGKHQVTVHPAPPEIVNELDDRPPPPSPFPTKYSQASKSGLTFDVKPGQLNEFAIELKSK